MTRAPPSRWICERMRWSASGSCGALTGSGARSPSVGGLFPAGGLGAVPLPGTSTLGPRDRDCLVNVAVTAVADINRTLQEPVPLHAPLQPVNVEPCESLNVAVTIVVDVRV